MKKSSDTLSRRLFASLFAVGILSSFLVALGMGVAFWCNAGNEMTATMTRMLDVAAIDQVWETGSNDPSVFKNYLRLLGEKGGYQRLCSYTKDNKLLTTWAANNVNDGCPSLIPNSGVKRDWRGIHIAVPVMHDERYLGVLYAESLFPGPCYIFENAGFAFFILLAVVMLVCMMATKLAMRHINVILKLVYARLEQIKYFNQPSAPLVLRKLTIEVAALDKELTDLKQYLGRWAITRTHADAIRGWHHKIISGLVSSLRQNIRSDSPVVHELEDYAFLLKTEKEIDLQLPQNFLLSRVFDGAIAAARAIHPLKSNVYLTVSLHAALRKEWSGQGEMLGILLRHLLLIALRRTRSGLVCLRLEVAKTRRSYVGQTTVAIILEDSGPQVQAWQLQQWLQPFLDDVPPVESGDDISWVLVGRLFHLLGGSVTAECDASGALKLKGLLSLNESSASIQPVTAIAKTKRDFHFSKPLALVVADKCGSEDNFIRFIKAASCNAFIVESEEQALAWAPVLPFSVIVINTALLDEEASIVRPLKILMNDNLMPETPLWAVMATTNSKDRQAWQQAGIDKILTLPLRPEDIESVCTALAPSPHSFYLSYDIELHNELPPRIAERLPELKKELARLLMELEPKIISLSQQLMPPHILHEVHALKSVALTLGYFRVAALMAEVENAIVKRDFADLPENWVVIRDCLSCSGFNTIDIPVIGNGHADYCLPL